MTEETGRKNRSAKLLNTSSYEEGFEQDGFLSEKNKIRWGKCNYFKYIQFK